MSASKWRLTKAEEKQVQDEGNAFKAEKLSEGMSEEEAQKARKEFEKMKEHQLKQAKADKNEARKLAKAKAAPPAALPSSKTPAMPDKTQNNQAYYAKLQDALQTIQNHKVFKRINEADALKITGDEKTSGVQAGIMSKLVALNGCVYLNETLATPTAARLSPANDFAGLSWAL